MNKWIEKLTLNQRLSLPIISFIVIVFMAFQVFSYQRYLNLEKSNLVTRTNILANGVGLNLTAPVLFNDVVAAHDILSAFKADTLIARVRLERPDHSLFAHYIDDSIKFTPPTPKQQHLIVQNGHHFGTEMLYIIVPILLDGENIAHMHIAVSLHKLQALRITHLKISLFLLLLLFGVGAYIINRMQLWVTNPITQLNKAIIRLIKGDEHKPLTQSRYTNDELSSLVSGFNQMVDKISLRDSKIREAMAELAEEKAFAEDVIETVQHALIVVNHHGYITLVNQACQHVFDIPLTQLSGKYFIDIIASDHDNPVIPIVRKALCKGAVIDQLTIQTRSSSGEEKVYLVFSRPLNQRHQTLFAIEDITDRYQAEKQQKLAANIFENSQDAILLFDKNGNISMVNTAFESMTGYSEADILGKPFRQLVDDDEYQRLQATILYSLNIANQWQGEINTRTMNNESLPLFVRVNQIQDSHSKEPQTVVIASDLRSMKEVQRLEHLANHDPLTNLPNRAKLHQSLRRYLIQQHTSQQVFAVLFIDLDGFKDVNDSYGHEAGDQVLKIIAEKLKGTVRKTDLVSRLAGDEFVILLSPIESEDGVRRTCQRLFDRIDEPIQLGSKALSISASIGCYYVLPNEKQNGDDILRRADKAMYEAKILGKGQVIEYNSMYGNNSG
ncbi:PAS domain S-box protein [Photobacterium sanctipauli]|uniref:PAS domain S-box protein n=1 Tax=Photobacterium sanctipauli TaxID=1342794 RepID=A0A2T3NNS8_9GAMM|nr:diguanylate cyclase [Photobacterium sanctipauli]PSW17619.1 PAS domain S-box protein [Photobacterium sanctipauli]